MYDKNFLNILTHAVYAIRFKEIGKYEPTG